MKKRKRGLRIKIDISNRWLYTLIVVGVLIVISVGVYAILGETPDPGHNVDELQPCSDGEILQMSGGIWICANLSTSNLKTKVIEIGDWNMNSVNSVSVPHGLTLSKIRSINVVIRNDVDANLRYFPVEDSSAGYATTCFDTEIKLFRLEGGAFDNTQYDSTSYNRGWITIHYVE